MNSETSRGRAWWQWAAPALVLAGLVFWLGVDVPQADQWDLVPLLQKAEAGHLTFADLYAQHNEHRIFFPKLIYLGLAHLTAWQVRYEMAVTFALACVAALAAWWLAGRQERGTWLGLMASVLIFSPVQWQNWLSGFQLQMWIPIVCLLVGLVGKSPVVAGVACVVATFSFGNGFLLWLILAPAVIKSWRGLSIWIVLAAVCLAAYLVGYQKPGSHPTLLMVVSHPLEVTLYFLALLGGPFAFGFRQSAIVQGLAVTVGAGLLVALGLAWRRTPRMMPWLLLGTFPVLSSVLTATSRSGFGVAHALASRYTTIAIWLPVALLFLYRPRFKPLVTGLVVLHVGAGVWSVAAMREFTRELRYGKACLVMINETTDDAALHRWVYPDVETLRAWAGGLDRWGWLRPRPVAAGEPVHLPRDTQAFTVGPDQVLTGWLSASADAVVFGAEDDNGVVRIIGMAAPGGGREALAKGGRLRAFWSADARRWTKEFREDELPAGTRGIFAWGVNADTGAVSPSTATR